MISSLYIKNIALIREHTLNFGKGLNVLSGETGAGKSIIIDSLNFVLGDRSDKSLIRHGQQSAVVEAVFDDNGNENVINILAEYGIEREESIIVRRAMTENGRSDCRVNGRSVTLSQLRKLVAHLVDIHSQHENQALLNEANHILILDKYGKKIAPLIEEYNEHLKKYIDAKNELLAFEDEASRARKIDSLEYQIAEIERVNPQINEEEELIQRRTKYQNAERIASALSASYSALDGEDGFGAINLCQMAIREISAVLRFDNKFEGLGERLDSVKIELRDVADELNAEIDNLSYDPRELEKIEERIAEIRKIKKRYGPIEDLPGFLEKCYTELDKLKNAESKIAELEEVLSLEASQTIKYAKYLHEERLSVAQGFNKAIVKNLKELGMKNTSFEAEISIPQNDEEILTQANDRGADVVRFLISPNLGEPLKPLSKIASGGEMSRFMLGLKNITAELEGIDTLVFDEIDTGISGVIAKVVAQKLNDVSTNRQVLAVTHLPQLASMADNHYLITKYEEDEQTITEVRLLDEIGAVKEIMRLAGSDPTSVVGEQNALELINWAKSYKNA